MRNHKNILNFSQRRLTMKTLLLFLFLVICAQTITAQTKPGIRIPGETPEQKMAKRQGFFKMGTTFEKDKRYYSEDNRYALLFQSDGNLVVYKMAGTQISKAIWSSGTNGIAVKSCVFQADGNLVLYNYSNKPVWSAFKKRCDFCPAGASWMAMQSDGNLVIYDTTYPSTSKVLFASGSFEKN